MEEPRDTSAGSRAAQLAAFRGPSPVDRVRRAFRRWFALPDVLLFGWVAVAQPTLFAASSAPTHDLLAGPRDVLLGALYIAAAAGALVVLLTRDADATAPAEHPVAQHELSLAGPTSAGMVIVFIAGFDLLGAPFPEWLLGTVFVAAFAGALARSRLFPIPGTARRLLVTPFIVAAAGIFDQMVVTAADLLDPRLLGAVRTGEELALVLTFVGIGIAFAGFFYLMLILAPRRLAGDRSDPWVWIARYALFVVSVLIGLALGALVA